MSGRGKIFTQDRLEAIAKALGDTQHGLTGSEIGYLLRHCRLRDTDPEATKWKRLHNAFVARQNQAQNRRAILEFIRQAMAPPRHTGDPQRFEHMREKLNQVLSFDGLAVRADGKVVTTAQATTLSDAQQRARALRETLETRDVHPDVLAFCREELVADDYFHAVLEAMKSVLEKLRQRTGLTDDGAQLVDLALGGNPPMLAINSFNTKSEGSEQRGFASLVKGLVGMFRNPTAHEPRATWAMDKGDAVELLSTLSLIHRRLDKAHIPPRV